MDSILDNVHILVASKLAPGQAASQHSTPSLGEPSIDRSTLVLSLWVAETNKATSLVSETRH
jgi:hypothetical protein